MTEPIIASTPLVCSDERHAAKVADLERQLDAARRMLSPDDLRLVDEMVATVEQEKDRAARAEATVARVRKACASVQAADQGHNPAVGWVVMRVLEAIDARLVNGAAPALASPCAGFPDQCPNPQPVPALSPYHGGGIRCGCTNPKENCPMTIAVDFDGVIHAYSRGWQDGTIYDPPLPRAIEGLRALMERDAVFIFTTREPEQVMPWLEGYGFDVTIDERCSHCARASQTYRKPDCHACKGSGLLTFWNPRGQLLVTNRKLAAVAYLDDRAVRFTDWDRALADPALKGA